MCTQLGVNTTQQIGSAQSLHEFVPVMPHAGRTSAGLTRALHLAPVHGLFPSPFACGQN